MAFQPHPFHYYILQMDFQEHKMGEGKLVSGDNIKHPDKHAQHKTYCFPLYSILLAMNVTKVDYFRLATFYKI